MQETQTPFLNDEYDIVNRAIYNAMNSKSSCSVGYVVGINTTPVSVNIQNGIKYFDKIQGFQEPPILSNVPVMQLSNAVYSIKTPLNVGDIGLILWFDREVYSYLLSSSVSSIEPDSGNLYNENACVFLPIMQKFSQANILRQTGVDIVSSEISLITEIVSLLTGLTTFCTTVAAAPTTNPLTPAYAAVIAGAATALNASLVSLNTAFTTFKGAQT